jgi:hypothetical protein
MPRLSKTSRPCWPGGQRGTELTTVRGILRPEQRTARALCVELRTLGYDGGYTWVTDHNRAWQGEQGKVTAANSAPPDRRCAQIAAG